MKAAVGYYFNLAAVLDPDDYEGNDTLETLAELAELLSYENASVLRAV